MNLQHPVEWGQSAPWFVAPAPINPTFDFSSIAGHFVVLVFFGHSELPGMREKLALLGEKLQHWPDGRCVIFGVTTKRADWQDAIVAQAFPRARVFLDEKWDIARAYGLLAPNGDNNSFRFNAGWFVLDPTLRVYSRGEMNNIERLIDEVARLPHASQHATASTEA